MLASMLSPTDSMCSGDGGTDSGNDGESSLDLLRDEDAGVRSGDGGAGLTGKVVISSSESDMMINGVNTPARGVVAGKGVGQDMVMVLRQSRVLLIMEYLVNISKRRAFKSLNEDILKITILKTNTPYPSRKIRRIRVCTHQRPQRNKAQYTISKEDQYAVLEIWNEYNILEDIKRVRMTKVIKGEFEKIKDVKVEDVSLAYDTSLEVFNNEVNQLSEMDDDLFTYEVEVANILCDSKMDDDSEHKVDDDMGYDPSDIRGDNKVELTDEESSDDKDEVAEVFRIDTNLFNFETPMCKAFKEFNYLLQIDPDLLTKDIEGYKTYEDYKDDWIYERNKDVPWVDEKPWTNARVWPKHAPVKHTCKPFNYKTRCSEWPTCSWMDDVYCNGGNLPGTYIIGNQLHYQDYKWYEALEESELKDEALRNKAIMEGFINEGDDESRYEQERRWNIYTNYDDAYEINHENNEKE
ncbi:hypothetical protein Tco_0312119 [Tanacetum coccineum]